GLLRGACHRARIRATRWLAMTALYSTIAWLFEKLNRHVVPASAHGEPALLCRLDPFRRTSPQRVAMVGTEKTEMADLVRSHIGWRDGEDLRPGRDISRAE